MSGKQYTNASKRNIANRISSITTKKHLRDLFQIAYNANNTYTKSSDGVHINLQILSDETLETIENFLDTHYPIVNSKPIIHGITSYHSDSNSGVNKLSNRELVLLRQIDSKQTTSDSKTVKITNDIIVKPFM